MNNIIALFVRSLFYISLLAIATFSAGFVAVGLFDTSISARADNLILHAGAAGIIGFVASLALARVVRCKACTGMAMVVPNEDSMEPGDYHQPWRRVCGRCGSRIVTFRR